MLADAQKYGARVALYGRKINTAENQLAFVKVLRLIVEGVIGPVEAVRAYHAVLERLGIRPHRPLEEDLKLQSGAMSYGGTTSVVVPPTAAVSPTACGCHGANGETSKTLTEKSPESNAFPVKPDGLPDFARMDVAQRLAYHRKRLGFGKS